MLLLPLSWARVRRYAGGRNPDAGAALEERASKNAGSAATLRAWRRRKFGEVLTFHDDDDHDHDDGGRL